jgi:hypothetical protein
LYRFSIRPYPKFCAGLKHLQISSINPSSSSFYLHILLTRNHTLSPTPAFAPLRDACFTNLQAQGARHSASTLVSQGDRGRTAARWESAPPAPQLLSMSSLNPPLSPRGKGAFLLENIHSACCLPAYLLPSEPFQVDNQQVVGSQNGCLHSIHVHSVFVVLRGTGALRSAHQPIPGWASSARPT